MRNADEYLDVGAGETGVPDLGGEGALRKIGHAEGGGVRGEGEEGEGGEFSHVEGDIGGVGGGGEEVGPVGVG